MEICKAGYKILPTSSGHRMNGRYMITEIYL
jgi:hypothetical protein